ncbi:tetratricopeptide repeat protein [Falsirhodobacter algicola]|uniref:Tetratricopeptide repeat protein n=1 Tax=Falsirhodobacter algicola TaxID=2692330 RepID=A0A8J8MSX7_9RHOB|nr:tetratricopeptide repeat protein [Falsirhodobacter algicola]QUS35889.1 tetratricopeptide repeat protein [Falsirhodobacter algicola]
MPKMFSMCRSALIGGLVWPLAGLAQDPGAYLAARVAAEDGNHPAAAVWFERALQADANNPDLLEGAIIGNIAAGNFDKAEAAAQTMGALGLNGQPMYVALLVAQVKAGDWDAVSKAGVDLPSVGALLQQLVLSWAELGRGNAQGALEGFGTVARTQGLEAFGRYHMALARAAVGDMEGAEAIFADTDHPLALTRRGVLAHVEILSQLDRKDEALALLRQSFAPTDPTVTTLSAALEAGETLPWDIARNPQDGVAEVFYTIAAALQGEAGDTFTLLYGRVATELRPDHAEAQMLVGGLLSQQGQPDLALAALDAVPETDPLWEAARIARGDALFAADRDEEAVAVLADLAKARPDALGPQVAYADALRRTEDYDAALPAYDRAIAIIGVPAAEYWPVLFSRGMVHERLGQDEEAERDMRGALELQPGQPDVLNYLGYSLVEQGRELDEALGMIRDAVEARPDSAAIQDSLAWALFRLGRFDEAVAPIETAILAEPTDPILTDHLGDIYWAVGRRSEARFQWRRALTFNPEPGEVERIQSKLENGLDHVLIEEGEDDFAALLAAHGHDAH